MQMLLKARLVKKMIDNKKEFIKGAVTIIGGLLLFGSLIFLYGWFISKPLPPYYHEVKALQEEMPEWSILDASKDFVAIARPLHPVEGFGENAFLMNIRQYTPNGLAELISIVESDCDKSEFATMIATPEHVAKSQGLLTVYDYAGEPVMLSDFVDPNTFGIDMKFYYSKPSQDEQFIKHQTDAFCGDWSREKQIISQRFQNRKK